MKVFNLLLRENGYLTFREPFAKVFRKNAATNKKEGYKYRLSESVELSPRGKAAESFCARFLRVFVGEKNSHQYRIRQQSYNERGQEEQDLAVEQWCKLSRGRGNKQVWKMPLGLAIETVRHFVLFVKNVIRSEEVKEDDLFKREGQEQYVYLTAPDIDKKFESASFVQVEAGDCCSPAKNQLVSYSLQPLKHLE